MTAPLLVLDYGGTKLTAALTRAGERSWLALERHESPPGHDGAYERAAMIRLARSVLRGTRPAAVGVSFGGPVAHELGLVRLSHHVPGWEETPLAAQLQAEFGAPVLVENDANAGALGEFRFGAGRGSHSLLYVTVSTGVGGGWILEGRAWRGSGGMAGEIGHLRVAESGPPCACGGSGCVESLASGLAIAGAARARLLAEPSAGATLRELSGNEPERVDARLVSRAAAQGDELAASVLLAAATALGRGIGSAANLVNPERFVLGGGVTKAGDAYWAQLRSAARATAMPEVELEILPAEFTDDAPLWGAVALAEDLIEGRTPPAGMAR